MSSFLSFIFPLLAKLYLSSLYLSSLCQTLPLLSLSYLISRYHILILPIFTTPYLTPPHLIAPLLPSTPHHHQPSITSSRSHNTSHLPLPARHLNLGGPLTTFICTSLQSFSERRIQVLRAGYTLLHKAAVESLSTCPSAQSQPLKLSQPPTAAAPGTRLEGQVHILT